MGYVYLPNRVQLTIKSAVFYCSNIFADSNSEANENAYAAYSSIRSDRPVASAFWIRYRKLVLHFRTSLLRSLIVDDQ